MTRWIMHDVNFVMSSLVIEQPERQIYYTMECTLYRKEPQIYHIHIFFSKLYYILQESRIVSMQLLYSEVYTYIAKGRIFVTCIMK